MLTSRSSANKLDREVYPPSAKAAVRQQARRTEVRLFFEIPQVPLVFSVQIHNHQVVDRLGTSLAALADPTRRQIVDRLSRGPATVGEIAAPLPMSQQAVSKHIAALERAKLISKTRQGRKHLCTLNAEPIREVMSWTLRYRRFWEECFDRLDEYLQELQAEGRKDGPDADAP